MRTLELTHDEFEIIVSALNSKNKYLSNVLLNARQIDQSLELNEISEKMKVLSQLSSEIENGYKDV